MMSNDELHSSVTPPSMRGLLQDPFSNPTITNPNPNPNPSKRKRNLPGTPDPDAEVIAMSPKSLMATNRFVCEICNKGFQRDQNLQLHRRGHNLPWKLKQRNKEEIVRKKVYICPEKTCAHHHPSRALGDLTGIKKHFSRKHGEKKWKCEKCSKKYAVMSDWKAHNKICGTREYKCDCGTLFSRKDSFITHRAFCDALVEESARFTTTPAIAPSANSSCRNGMMNVGLNIFQNADFSGGFRQEIGGLESGNQLNRFPLWLESANNYQNSSRDNFMMSNANGGLADEIIQLDNSESQWLSRGQEESFVGEVLKEEDEQEQEEEESNKRNLSESQSLYYNMNHHNHHQTNSSAAAAASTAPISATALLQKAAQMGSTRSAGFGLMSPSSFSTLGCFTSSFKRSGNDDQNVEKDQIGNRNVEGESSLTRDFLGVGGKELKSNFFASISSTAMEMGHYNRNH